MSSTEPWSQLLTRSLATRLDPETFTSYAELLAAKHPAPSSYLADLFLRPTSTNHGSLDPRVPRYLQALLDLGLVNLVGILGALRRYSTFGVVAGEGEEGAQAMGAEREAKQAAQVGGGGRRRRWTNSYTVDEMLFYRLAGAVSAGKTPRGAQEAAELVRACVAWMQMVTRAGHGANEMLGLGGHPLAEEMNNAGVALGVLVVAVVDNGRVVQMLGTKGAREIRTQLAKALAGLVPLLVQSSAQTAGRLELFRTQTLAAMEPVGKKNEAGKEIDDILEEGMGLGVDSMVVPDLPTMNSRAGLYIYLNALVRRPHIVKSSANWV
jgi:mediator of RNA polymerase II transcription subunit 5